jgi:hypothetical protein
MDEIINILNKCSFKGKYVTVIKQANLWHLIENSVGTVEVSDPEKVYLYLNPLAEITCSSGNKRKFKGVRIGYNLYCENKKCDICNTKKKQAVKQGVFEKYGVDNVGKLQSAIISRDKFWNDKSAIEDANSKRKQTNLTKYGCENVFQNEKIKENIKNLFIERYGVENPSQSEIIKEKKKNTLTENYGVPFGLQSPIIKEKIKTTNTRKYGVPHIMQVNEIKNKMIATKIAKGSFGKSNSSIEATTYFKNYIKTKGYNLSQVAFNDPKNGLYEWGFRFDRWYLFDFVAFELGHRGDYKKIIEIIEYHGPFHYTESDVMIRGSEKAYPWKSNNTTILESYQRDIQKQEYAVKYLTTNYNVIWSENDK